MWRIFIPNGEACVPVGAIDHEEIDPDWKLVVPGGHNDA